MSKWMPLLLCGILVVATVAVAEPTVYKQIRIVVPDRATLGLIWATGVDPEGAVGKVGGAMEFVAAPGELDALRRSGIPFDVVVEDLAAQYESGLRPGNALGFGYGSMGGFYTYAEVVQQLDSMRLLYPSLITAKQSLDSTVQGRRIWIVKISDNPETAEPTEAEVLYTALHHAREPQGMMSVLYYMWWLLQNYGSDPDATYLINNRQMWFLPVVNPDGYVYNQTTNPSGGGMWRKNRRNNGGSYGVDLNRNYGPFSMWNSSNGGSSTNPADDTYRGPSAFSERETHAVETFLRSHTVRTALNYHTYSNLLIYPWGYLSRESGDSLLFREWAYDFTMVNHYVSGTDLQTVNYATRGNSDDFMYGDTTKPRTYAMTPEVGTSGFWPTTGQILPLAIENTRANALAALVAGHFPKVRSLRILEADSNGSVTRNESFTLAVRIRNAGLGTAAGLSVTASSDVSWLTFPGPATVIPALAAQAETEVMIGGIAGAGTPDAGRCSLYLYFTDADGFQKTDTALFFAGNPVQLFADSARTGTSKWTTGQGWGTTAQAHTPPFAFTDSPSGNYAAYANNSLTMVNAVSLSGYQFAELRFWTRWSVEPTWDFATVEVSTNNGGTWKTLRTALARPGSNRSGGQQPAGTWGYDAYTPGLSWSEQRADLTPYAGSPVKVRFRLAADGGEERDGFLVDDIRVLAYTTVTPPAAPILVSPSDGTGNHPEYPRLIWNSVEGATGYHLQVSSDSLFSAIVVNDSTLTDSTRSAGPLLPATEYFWRVRARNFAGFSPYSGGWRFTTTAVPPPAPLLISPAGGAPDLLSPVFLVWRRVAEATRYHLQLSADSLFAALILNDSTLTDTVRASGPLPSGVTLYWRIRGRSFAGGGTFSPAWNFTTMALPLAPLLLSPPDGATGQLLPLTLLWGEVQSASWYRLQLSLDSLFSALVVDDSVAGDTAGTLSMLLPGTGYYWRVLAGNPAGWGPASEVRSFATAGMTTRQYAMTPLWNLLSLPLAVGNAAVGTLFPGAASAAFTFSPRDGYLQVDTLLPGAAYWLKFDSAQTVTITGMPVAMETVAVTAGWNLVGGISEPIDTSLVVQIPAGTIGSPFFCYDGGYAASQILAPMRGYWVKAVADGLLVIGGSLWRPAAAKQARNVPGPNNGR